MKVIEEGIVAFGTNVILFRIATLIGGWLEYSFNGMSVRIKFCWKRKVY